MYKNHRLGNAKKSHLSHTGEIQNTKNKDVGYVCTRIIDLEMQKRVT